MTKPRLMTRSEQTANSLMIYLAGFLAQSEAGLIICDSFESTKALSKFLRSQGLQEKSSAESCLQSLADGQSTFVTLTPPLDTQMYYLLCQYARRPGLIQLLNRRTYELAMVSIEPTEAHLLFLVTRSDLLAIEERHAIRDKIGLVERFSTEVLSNEVQVA